MRPIHLLKGIVCLVLFLLSFTQEAVALDLPQIFASHMVLQRDIPVTVWGNAQPDSTVFVEMADQRAVTIADSTGHWQAWLKPMPANAAGQKMMVTGDGTQIVYEDILIGDVWLCSGQSNMEWPVRGMNEAEQAMEQAYDPSLRLCLIRRNFASEPQTDTWTRWSICDSKSVSGFTAVGYCFGKYLRDNLNIPIGLIHAAWGGTPCEAWTSSQAIDGNPRLLSIRELWERQVADYPTRLANWETATEAIRQKQQQWLENNPDKTRKQAQQVHRLPRKPFPPDATPFAPSVLCNGMIAPISPYTIKGAIWYQGEANAGRPDEYRSLLPTMIKDWRTRWAPTPMPFGIVQLANFRKPLDASQPPVDSGWPHLRDAQRHTVLSLPQMGLATIIDIGDANTIHPRNKQDVGERLGLWALHDIYGQDVAFTGPVFETAEVAQGRMRLTFSQVGEGLRTIDGKAVGGFILTGEDRSWHWAQARIVDSNQVEVWCEDVPDPIAVRYAWADNPVQANLTNDSSLPASPFRSDDWPFGH